jgi:hypothetical protein
VRPRIQGIGLFGILWTMKNAEQILGLAAVFTVGMYLLSATSGGAMTILSLFVLACFYFGLGFALFLDVPLNGLLKRESYQGITPQRIILSGLAGLSIAIVIIGVLFQLLYWPGGAENLQLGLFGLLVALIVGWILYQKDKSPFYVNIFTRIAIFGVLALVFYFRAPMSWQEMKYKNHQEYLRAFKATMEDPEDPDLWETYIKEQEKLRGN